MMTDPLADMLTRIRNASAIERPAVEMPATKLKANVAKVLKYEGFVEDFQVGKYGTDDNGQPVFQSAEFGDPKAVLRVYLKYGPDGERVTRPLERASRPGRRLYRRHDQLRRVLEGLGISIISTSRGVMSDREARKAKVG